MNIQRFKQIINYDPKRGLIKESKEDTNGWLCIGEIPGYFPWGTRQNKVYIMVDPQERKNFEDKTYYKVLYTENSDGTGAQDNDVPYINKCNAVIYPEYSDTVYGEMFLGKKKDEQTLKKQHEEFLQKLFLVGNKVILHHNSSVKLTDGFIKKGKPNGWSNNTDIGIYFWGSRECGNDPSNASTYTYYCRIFLEELYDKATNVERLSTEQAMKKYGYCGQYWKNSDAIVVNTFKETPIYCILDKQTGKWYDKNWNEISNPF